MESGEGVRTVRRVSVGDFDVRVEEEHEDGEGNGDGEVGIQDDSDDEEVRNEGEDAPRPITLVRKKKDFFIFVRVEAVEVENFALRVDDEYTMVELQEVCVRYWNQNHDENNPWYFKLSKMFSFDGGDKILIFEQDLNHPNIRQIKNHSVLSRVGIYLEPPASDKHAAARPEMSEIRTQIFKKASLNRLVLKLTEPGSSLDFVETFLYTYRSFCDPDLLLQKIVERYAVPLPPLSSRIDEEFFELKIRLPLQQCVGNILAEWIRLCPTDFSPPMHHIVDDFARHTLTKDGHLGVAKTVQDQLRNAQHRPGGLDAFQTLPDSGKIASQFDATIIAEQLSLLTMEAYRKLTPSEMLYQQWKGVDFQHQCPNLFVMVQLFARIVSFVTYSILSQEDVKDRASLIKTFYQTMANLKSMRSYDALAAVHIALGSTSITRLTRTFETLKKEIEIISKEIHMLMDPEDDFIALWRVMENASSPCIPHTGLYLERVCFIEDNEPSIVDELVNFERSLKLRDVQKMCLRSQSSEFHFKPDNGFVGMLLHTPMLEERALYDLSLKVEPRGSEVRQAKRGVGLFFIQTIMDSTKQQSRMQRTVSLSTGQRVEQELEWIIGEKHLWAKVDSAEVTDFGLFRPKVVERPHGEDGEVDGDVETEGQQEASVASGGPPRMLRRESSDASGLRRRKSQRGDEPAIDPAEIRAKNIAFVKEIVPQYVTEAPFPFFFPTELQLKIHYEGVEGVTETCDVNVHSSMREIMSRILSRSEVHTDPDKHIDDYIAKATGSYEFLLGEHPLSAYEYVRSCLKKATDIGLTIFKLEDVVKTLDSKPQFEPAVQEIVEGIEGAMRADDLHTPLRFRIRGVKQLASTSPGLEKVLGKKGTLSQLSMCVTCGIFHGGVAMSPIVMSTFTVGSSDPTWNEWIETGVHLSGLPEAARLCFTVWGLPKKKESQFWKYVSPRSGDLVKEDSSCVPLSWVNVQLVDHRGFLRTGLLNLSMWQDDFANPIGTCVENFSDPRAPVLVCQLDTFPRPVVVVASADEGPASVQLAQSRAPGEADRQRLEAVMARDPLYDLNEQDMSLLWEYRTTLVDNPAALPKFLQAVAWNDRRSVAEAHTLLLRWKKFENPVDALQLLDSKFSDRHVRAFAVACIDQLPDERLVDYLLQLTQVLKYESYHESSLAKFLVRRALEGPQIIGHALFWHLKAEMHVQSIRERYGLLIQDFLRCVGGPHRKMFIEQNSVIQKLCAIADVVKCVPKQDRKDVLHGELEKVVASFPEAFALPLDPRMRVKGLRIEKCKCMDSKKVPLWLVFENADPNGGPTYVIFKAGDDLRQDLLTLQMLRIMDKLWQQEGMDLGMNVYGCVATGDEEGMIEIVMNSDTTANITKTIGGGAKAAFRKDTIEIWLKQFNTTPDAWDKCVENFIRSCAGYSVATYVLGIGDRHNDNVMLTKQGQLFHIDFGHFLGNIKRKFGMKRERAPFVFTPDFAQVMGGKGAAKFDEFVKIAGQAFNVIRRNADLFINLFALMLSTGIPELRRKDDIEYLRNVLVLDQTEEEAAKTFRNLILKSLSSKATQINNMVHILAH